MDWGILLTEADSGRSLTGSIVTIGIGNAVILGAGISLTGTDSETLLTGTDSGKLLTGTNSGRILTGANFGISLAGADSRFAGVSRRIQDGPG